MNDPIVDEVRKVRDAHAARFNYDLDAIFRDIKEQERNSGRKFVSFAPVKAEPNKTLQPTGAVIPVSQGADPPKATPALSISVRPVIDHLRRCTTQGEEIHRHKGDTL